MVKIRFVINTIMRGVNKNYFGQNGISVTFNDNGTIRYGYIVNQLGSRHFVVTTDGTTRFVVRLCRDLAEATTIPINRATIAISTINGTEFCQYFTNTRVTTMSGDTYFWSFSDTPTSNTAILARFEPNQAIIPAVLTLGSLVGDIFF